MSNTRGQGPNDGILPSLSDLVGLDLAINTRVETLDGQRYKVTSVDEGGVQLPNSLWLNLVSDASVDTPNNQTGTTYTIATGDEGKTVWMNNVATNVVSVPLDATTDFPINTIIMVIMEGAGVTSVTSVAGVLLNGIDGGSGDLVQLAGLTLIKRAANSWVATPLTVT